MIGEWLSLRGLAQVSNTDLMMVVVVSNTDLTIIIMFIIMMVVMKVTVAYYCHNVINLLCCRNYQQS